jgi:hypothetical protein
MLANPLRIDGKRLGQAACPAAGADNDRFFEPTQPGDRQDIYEAP